MLIAISAGAVADLPTPATTTLKITNHMQHQQQQQAQIQSQQLTNRCKQLYATKQQQSRFHQPSLAPPDTMIPPLVCDDGQINKNDVVNTSTTTTTTPPTTPIPDIATTMSSSILSPTFAEVFFMNTKTPTVAATKTTTARRRTLKATFLYTTWTMATTATTLASSAISAVTSTLVKTTNNLTLTPPQLSATLKTSLQLSSTPSSSMAATTSALSYTTTTLSTFLEGDLLPVVFLNANIIHQQMNETNSTSNNRSNTTLGLGSTDTDIDTAVAAVGTGTTRMNFDDDDDNLNSFYFYETEQFAFLWILFTTIVLGNSVVLFVMFLNKSRKSRMNYFIKQLALADLFVGLLSVLTDIIWRMTISWRAGNVACKIIRFSQVCVTYSSTYVLVAMSIDRYDAITHPMNFSKSWRRAKYLVATAWILSAIFSTPILMLYEEKLVQGQTQCWIELGSPWAWQVYMSLVSLTLFAFPAIIISVCYAIIVKTIWAKGSIFVPAERAGFVNNPTRRASSRGIIPRAKVKTVKMTFVIVIVFILCWSPYIIFDLLQVFGHIPQTQTNIAIATFIQSLAPLNSAANPLIYCLFSSTVFRTLSRFAPFKWFECCNKSYRHSSSDNRGNTVRRGIHNSCDSMRTLTTSLTVSRRSNKRPTHVVICDRPKSNSIHRNAMSEV